MIKIITSIILSLYIGESAWAQNVSCSEVLTTKRLAAVNSATSAGLNYSLTRPAGITRRPRPTAVPESGKRPKISYNYYDSDGRLIKDEDTVSRINALAVPPGWKDVAISGDPDSHIQAIGWDDAGRVQYKYHHLWNEYRKDLKFKHILNFGKKLPTLRERTNKDLAQKTLTKEKVLALVVQLLEKSLIRVGSEEYKDENGTYGLTTFEKATKEHKAHIRIDGSKINFDFVGKEHLIHQFSIEEGNLANALKQCLDLPGIPIFQYVDKFGDVHPISAADVNAYIQETIGKEFTAKNFRTWMGTVIAANILKDFAPPADAKEEKALTKFAMEYVAAHLRNEPNESKVSYVHPTVLEGFRNGLLFKAFGHFPQEPELAVLWLLTRNR